MSSNTPRRYCEYNSGRISRRYLNRTQEDPQHHIRTDKIGSRHDEWRRKDTLDLQCSTYHTKELTREREDQLWATNPRNRRGNDPLANLIGWYAGDIDQTAWNERSVRCYRRIKPASELRSRKKNSALHRAHQKAKAEREAEEGESANVLTPHEQSRLRALVNDASYLALTEARKVEEEAMQQKEEREAELKNILASLTTVIPVVATPDRSPVVTPIQMHPDRMAQLAVPSTYQLPPPAVKHVDSEQELRRRRALKHRRAKAKLEGRPFEEDERDVEDKRGRWQVAEYDLKRW